MLSSYFFANCATNSVQNSNILNTLTPIRTENKELENNNREFPAGI